jgi:hypothetical protein
LNDRARSNDKVVQFVAWVLGCVQDALSFPLYTRQGTLIASKVNAGRPWLYYNYIYLLEWVLVMVGLVVAAPHATGPLQLAFVALALWRAAEILVWYIKLLFDKGHRVFLEAERNMLFLVADSAVFVTALALMLETGDEGHLAARWSAALSAFTLNGQPDGYESAWATATGVLGTIGGLAMIGAGLGILIGIIGQRIQHETGSAYTGPRRPAPPWMKRSDD